MTESAREFFEEAKHRIDPERTRGMRASYRFDVDGVGSWHLDVNDGDVVLSESDADADCVIQASESDFVRIARGEQSAVTAYMLGRVKVQGDVSLATRLRDLFA